MRSKFDDEQVVNQGSSRINTSKHLAKYEKYTIEGLIPEILYSISTLHSGAKSTNINSFGLFSTLPTSNQVKIIFSTIPYLP